MNRPILIIISLVCFFACKEKNRYLGDSHTMLHPPCTSMDKAIENKDVVYELILRDTVDSIKTKDIIKLDRIHRLKIDSKIDLDTFPGMLVSLQNLDWVQIRNSEIKCIDYQVQHLPHLSILEISNAQISEFPLWITTDWLKLSSINLEGNNISSLPRDVANMKSLYALNLSDNHIKEIPFDIGELTDLEYLNLTNNDLRDIPSTISNLYKNLKGLYLEGNDIDSARVQWLIENLPYTDIKTDVISIKR